MSFPALPSVPNTAPYLSSTLDTLSLTLTLSILYHQISSSRTLNLKTTRQKSWILTAFASAVLTLGSAPVVWRWAWGRGEGDGVGGAFDLGVVGEEEVRRVGEGVMVFFRAYLIADLVVGSIHYPDQISLLTGWFHHCAYIVMLTYVRRTEWCGIFLLAAILELPTLHLSLSHLSPHLFRSDPLFLLIFFLTRILFHAYLITSFALPSNRQSISVLEGSLSPSVLLASAMPLHLVWFWNGLRGWLRRREKARRGALIQKKEEGLAAEMDLQFIAPEDGASRPLHTTPETFDDIPALEADSDSDDDDEPNLETPAMPATIVSSSMPMTPFTLEEAGEYDFGAGLVRVNSGSARRMTGGKGKK